MRLLGFLLFTFAFVAAYQNCGDVTLSAPKLSADTYLRMSGEFCSTLDCSASHSLQAFYVVNLTARASRFSGYFLADSDMDGIPDSEEVAHGFDPQNRRTYGILDVVCLDAGAIAGDCEPGVSGNFLTFGLMDIDIEGGGAGQMGWDQDQDKIPDLLELLYGTLINVMDGDMLAVGGSGDTNIEQIQKGLAPRTSKDENISPSFYTLVYTRLIEASTGKYSFQIEQLPLLETVAFTSSVAEESYLNHAANENVILFIVVSIGVGGQQQLSYVVKKVDYNDPAIEITIAPEDFQPLNVPATF